MLVLRQSTQRIIRVGSFMDATDGVTPETGVTLGAADQAELMKPGGGASIDISGRTWAAVTGAGGWYDLTLTTTDTNTVGDGTIAIQDASLCLPVLVRFTVVEEAVYDAMYAASAVGPAAPGGAMDVLSISGSSTAADNMETLFDGVEGFAAAYAGRHGPGVYLDDSASNTNTVNGVDGTWNNPVSTIAAAKTIADSLGVLRIYLVSGSDITIGATMTAYQFVGGCEPLSAVINLGSQDVSGSAFFHLTVEGTQGGSGRIYLEDCAIQDPGPGDTTLHLYAQRCGIVDRLQVDTSNDNVFDQCFSLVAGTAAPIIQATGAAGTISMRHYSGGIEFESLSASHNVSVETDGQVIFDATCNVNATVALRGNLTITDNTAGMNNLSRDAALSLSEIENEVLDALLSGHTDAGTTGAALNLIGGIDSSVANLESMLIMREFTVAAGSIVSEVRTGTVRTTATDHYKNAMVVVYDVSADEYANRICKRYLTANDRFVFDQDLPFTPEIGVDKVWVLGPTIGRQAELISASAGNNPTLNAWFDLMLNKDSGQTYNQGTDAQEALAEKQADIEADTQDIQGRLPAALVGGRMDSDVQAISGDTTAAVNLEADYDGTGYNKTASEIGTVAVLTGHTPQTGDSYTRLGAPAGASVSADIASIKADTAGLGTTLTGITSLAEWLGAMSGKQVPDATALSEIRDTGAGSGTYDATTDSPEAIRDTAPLGTAMRGTDSALLATSAPANFQDLSITATTGRVDVATIQTAAADTVRDRILSDSTAFAGGNINATVSSRATPAQVLTQVNAALDTAIVELAQAAPSATPTLRTGLMLLYMALRNRLDVDTSGTDVLEIRNDAGTVIAKKELTDDGSTYSEAEMESGP